MSENERQSQTNAVINDKLQGTVVTYLRSDRMFDNQIKTGLLLSLQVKKIKNDEFLAYLHGQKADCFVHFL